MAPTYLTHKFWNISNFYRKNGLLIYEMGVQHYKLTEKGIQFLRSYEKISELVAVTKTRVAVKQPDNESPAIKEWVGEVGQGPCGNNRSALTPRRRFSASIAGLVPCS
jgi:hypothetical protein